MYLTFFKRLFDLIVAIILLIILCPLLVIIFVLVKIDSKGPLFFKQERVGKDLRLFKVIKIRTMTNVKRAVGNKPVIGRATGVTRAGYYLRRYKIDELPQFVNVLKGDISLVGPRPSVREQLDKMTEEEKKRYLIKPGLTGLSQVSGNIHLTWNERYQMDLEYVRNVSFANDARILARTALVILKGEDYYLDKPLRLK